MKKRLLFIGTFVITTLFAGCSKDEEKNPLVGTWESDVISETFYGRSTPYNIKGRDIFIFYADNRVAWKWTASDDTYEGKYTADGNSITITFADPATGASVIYGPGESFDLNFANGEKALATVTEQTYLINGNNLTIERKANVPLYNGQTTYATKAIYKRVVAK